MPASSDTPTPVIEAFVRTAEEHGLFVAVAQVPFDEESTKADPELYSYVLAVQSAAQMAAARMKNAYAADYKGIMTVFTPRQQEALRDYKKMRKLQEEGVAAEDRDKSS